MVSRLIAFYINPSPQQFANDQAGEREIVTNKFLAHSLKSDVSGWKI